MPSYMLGKVLMAVIGAKFPGGIEGWAQAGCDMVALPNPTGKDIAYILTPDDTCADLDLSEFREGVEMLAKRNSFEARWLTRPNFEDRNPAEIKATMEQTVEGMVRISEHSNVARLVFRSAAVIVVLDMVTEEEADTLLESLGKVDGLRLAVVISPALLRDRTYGRNTGLQVARPERCPIDEHDEADLKILLHEAESVDEFLKRI